MTLPVALTGTDLIGQARTGTGKTYAFSVPLLQRIVAPDERDYASVVEAGKPQALVVAPTRELAAQVTGDLQTASTVRRVRILTLYGGRAYEPQVAALRTGVDVVVGTPGRILDLANQGELDLGHVKVLVLDEADEMLDLGFLPDVEKIIARTPELRQTMLFSATMPGAVVALARRYMRHPVNVRAESPDEGQTVPATAQFIYQAHSLDKDEMLARILQAEGRGLSIVFCRTKRQAQRVADEMAARGFAAAAVHGDLGQGQREQALRAFRSGKVDVLVATDVAARGIDVEGVTHVINFSCPEDEKPHWSRRRLGRGHHPGRLGRRGALADDQPGPRAPLRLDPGDLLDEREPLPRPRHPELRQGFAPPRTAHPERRTSRRHGGQRWCLRRRGTGRRRRGRGHRIEGLEGLDHVLKPASPYGNRPMIMFSQAYPDLGSGCSTVPPPVR